MKGRKIILVVDDDATFLQTAEEQLSEYGYTVLLALSGEQARLLVQSVCEVLDAAVIDIVMPEENGLMVIGNLRKTMPNLPLIAITERASETDLEVARYIGASAALRKPISRDWPAAIGRLLSESPGQAASAN